MSYVIRSRKGTVIRNPNGSLRVFKTADEAMEVIEGEFANSPYLYPSKLKERL